MKTRIERYKGGRNWGVWLDTGAETELVAVVLYKRGAESVRAVLQALIAARGQALSVAA